MWRHIFFYDEQQRFSVATGHLIYCGVHSVNLTRYNRESNIFDFRCAPWFRLINFGDDLSFIEMTGLTRKSFIIMENQEDNERRKRDLPPSFDNRGQLGLRLFFIGSTMKTFA